MSGSDFKIATLVEFDEQRVRDLLCSAWEGGSNYWCRVEMTTIPPAAEAEVTRLRDAGEMFGHIYPFIPGVQVVLQDVTGEDSGHGTEWTLTREKLIDGLQALADKAPYHFANFVAENDDSETGDVYLQMCLFGEIVFG
jgi:hypothetical protein